MHPTLDILSQMNATRTFTRRKVDINGQELDITVTYKLGMLDAAKPLAIDEWIFTVCTDIGLREEDGTPIPVSRTVFKERTEQLQDQARKALMGQRDALKAQMEAAGEEWSEEDFLARVDAQVSFVAFPPDFYKWAIYWLVQEESAPKNLLSRR